MKFRGKVISDITCEDGEIVLKGTWIDGSLITDNTNPYIVGSIIDYDGDCVVFDYWCPVDENTVGLYSGFTDCNGSDCCKDDVIRVYKSKYPDSHNTNYFDTNVVYVDGCFMVIDYTYEIIPLYELESRYYKFEIIGNIHDNPNWEVE